MSIMRRTWEAPSLLTLLTLVELTALRWFVSAAPQAEGECRSALGMQSGSIPDEHISASSYFDGAVNAIYARAHLDLGGGAWCPREMVYREGKEFLEVNLGSVHIITKVEVQGRFGNGQGREFTRHYKLQLWRPGMKHWVTYTDGRGKELLEGNTNTYLAQASELSPPVIATRVRFVPYSDPPRTICMRVEIFGCPYTDGVVSYSMMDGDARGNDDNLRDLTYDGTGQRGWLSGGLGQLVDRETGHSNFRVDAHGADRGYEWVGWKNESFEGKPVEITFEFDTVRNFSQVHLFTNNLFTKDAQVFSRAEVFFSLDGDHFDAREPIEFESPADRIFENARNVTVDLQDSSAKYVRLRLHFALRWILISEVVFDSVPCSCNETQEEPLVVPEKEVEEEKLTNPDVQDLTPVVPADSSTSRLLVGGLATLGVIFVVIPIALCALYYRYRLTKTKTPPSTLNSIDAKKVSMKMRDFQMNMNLAPTSNGYMRSKSDIYGHLPLDEEAVAMYQEPFKSPLHNPGYFTLGGTLKSSEVPLKCSFPLDTDDSVDYAVPDISLASPQVFPDLFSPPPPVPLTRPPTKLPNIRTRADTPITNPIPAMPPPPDQQYFVAPQLCHASNIQGVTGSVIYAVADASNVNAEHPIPEIDNGNIKVLETLGQGLFGIVQLCEIKDDYGATKLVAMKSLKVGTDESAKKDFHQEARLLSQLDDPNIVKLVGMVTQIEPLCMLLEYMKYGDLYQFLRRHRGEGTVTPISFTDPNSELGPTLSYGALIYIASQIASGMKHLETLNLVHRDLASRNCLVGSGLTIKISDFSMSRALYSSDYYRIGEGRALLPIRWMAWESILHGKFSTKSDVWSFGVTMWEILTMARQQPYDDLSDEGVLENVSHCYHGDETNMILLPHPPLCPREMYDMMTACWRPNDRDRPPFWEILMFLQRKNLGYNLDYDE